MRKLSHQTLSAIFWLGFLTTLIPVGAEIGFPIFLWFMLGMAWGVSLSLLIVTIRLRH
jgi:hypothetical protein